MPLTEKGQEIKANMEKQYGKKKGEQVFYASENAGTITGVHDVTPVYLNSGAPDERTIDDAPIATTAMTTAEINEKNKQFWAPAWGQSTGEEDIHTEDELPAQSTGGKVVSPSIKSPSLRNMASKHPWNPGPSIQELQASARRQREAHDQPISPIGLGTPYGHNSMAQEPTNIGPVGSELSPTRFEMGKDDLPAHSTGGKVVSPSIEAHGVRGMKSTPWRKIFKSPEHLNKRVEKNQAEVHATREVEE